ncbi:MAG: hypothetical protein KC502_04210 [Myxococcales bacterium]|nr:hypothetical protein [Myxococcales bacterium]
MAWRTALVTVIATLIAAATPLRADASIRSRAKKMSNEAARLFAEKKFVQAAERFEQAYALDSKRLIRLRNAGRAYEEARAHQQALHCFRRYVKRVKSVKLREDAKTRIARLEARISAAEQAKLAPKPKPAVVPVARPKLAKKPPPPTIQRKPSDRVLPVSIGIAGVGALVSGGTLLWLASGASGDIDRAEAKGDYGYPGGETKLKDDRSLVGLNQTVGWGLVGAGLVGAGVSTWLLLRGETRVALLPAGPGSGPGLTGLVRF